MTFCEPGGSARPQDPTSGAEDSEDLEALMTTCICYKWKLCKREIHLFL